ncbi:MAG: hypothetical protein CL993_00905 [Euryarchaeota archaeon]|nr:hypothetical protein [Euryarchaeota archaeon]
MADGSDSVISGLIILFVPLLLAIPVSFAWKWWIGTEPEHEHYREKVRRVLDSGIPLSRYRSELDAEAIKVEILSDRQARIESDLIHPLRLYHFLLFPSLVLWPLVGLFAAIITIPMMPVFRLIEWILIDKKVLSNIAKFLQGFTRWEIIAIPINDGAKELDGVFESIYRMPITVFLGLFAYLIVSYLPYSPSWIFFISAIVYIFLVSTISVIRVATESILCFADPSHRRIIPMVTLVDDALGPSVGVGLIFLLSRQLLYGSSIRADGLLQDPISFAISVLLVLYTATIIGITVELIFFRSRGQPVKDNFLKQIIDEFNPMVYLYTRSLGSLHLSALVPLSKWLEENQEND